MYKRLPADKKLLAIKRVLAGEKVSKVCNEIGVSRTVFYRWFNDYQKTGPKGKRKVLRAKVVKGNTHWKSFDGETQRKILKLAIKKPHLSPREIAEVVHASPSGVWYVLKRNGLNTLEARQQYIYRNGDSLVREMPSYSKLLMMQRYENREKVSEICREYKVSRTIFYRWLKRYEADKCPDSLKSLRPKGEEHYRYVREAPELIAKIVASNPTLSHQKICEILNSKAQKKLMSQSGVYYVLKRLNLNTYQKRLAFAQSHAPTVAQIPLVVREERIPIGNIPNVSSLAPPGFFGKIFSASFVLPFILVFLASLSTYILLSSILNVHSLAQKVGTVFAFTSLVFGMFFFIYSLKYYITIAAVLSFSRNKEGERKNFMSSIFGLVSGRGGRQGQVYRNGQGLDPKLSETFLKWEPFVSIHLASYNEKKVINRLLTAVTSLDYKNYEIIVADDSTDETKDLLKTWSKNPRVIISHREERTGYKGGALKEALKITDPRAEFVIVFDADFIPYPDTINQFLKYFQSLVGGLSQEELKASNIAAVQGYQWHVLNKSENWITRGVRAEYSGSYVIERSGEEIYGGLKQISGSVYMIRRDVLEKIGWGTSITEDFELTLKLYEKGYKVVYTPYIQAPAEAVSTIKRLIRQRMRWAEGHSHNVRKMFKSLMFSDQLSTGEKLEFAYLTPYYLQAAFFIAGTLCWFLSETVFQVRLPFWTDVWGWSLVLTNLFALPLMNMVGMFLEEAEEKDYMGLLSFVVLSYVVAPFQAYSAIKGFFETEEGPWFRTPKTGRITDTFSPSRFYKFVFGVFGRGKPAEAESTLNNGVAIKKAFVPNFNPGVLKPKKLRRIGRSAVVATLIFTLGLNLLSFNQNLFNLRQDRKTSGEAKIIGSKDFLETQTPQFRLKLPKESGKVSWYEKLLPKKAIAQEPQVTATVLNQSNQPVNISPKIVKVGQDYTIIIPDAVNLKPGKYKLNTFWRDQNGIQHTSSQDFTWGVLAINTNKSIYAEGETAELGFGTLDDKGKTLCDSDLNLDITSPDGQKTSLSSDNGQIKQSGKCAVTSVTNTADYLTQYQTDKTGTYKLHLTATTQNGKRSIDDKFEVKDSKDIPFDVERVSYPTRIYPMEPYTVQIKVQAYQDFKGQIVEQVPASFELKVQNSNLKVAVKSSKSGKKEIVWDVDWRKGEVHNLSYTIKFPRQSPEFYLVGPLAMKQFSNTTIWREARQWQIASDAVATVFMETPDALNGASGDIKTQFWSGNAGRVVYDKTVTKSGIGSWKAGGLGGSADLVTGSVMPTGASQGGRVTVWVYFQQLPTNGGSNSESGFLEIGSGTSNLEVTVLNTGSGGTLKMYDNNNATLLGTGTANTISAGTWYRITLVYKTNASSQMTDAKEFLNGTVDISATGLTQALTGTISIGWLAGGLDSTDYMNLQHVYADNSTALTDIGDVRVTAKRPYSNGTAVNFGTQIGTGPATTYGTGHAQQENERPLNNANGWQVTGTSGAKTEEYSIESVSAGDVDITGLTLVDFEGWIDTKIEGNGSTPTWNLILAGGTTAITVTTTETMFTKIAGSTTYPTGNTDIGESASSGAGKLTDLYEAGTMFAYIAAAVPEEALLLAPLALFAPKIIKSIQQGTVIKDISEGLKKILGQVREIIMNLIDRKRRKLAVGIKRKRKKKGG